MNYEEFKNKWGNRLLYEHVGFHQLGGRIEMWLNQEVKLPHLGLVKADLFSSPTYHGWRDEKQRREYYRDAKKVGVKGMPNKKFEWYKLL